MNEDPDDNWIAVTIELLALLSVVAFFVAFSIAICHLLLS